MTETKADKASDTTRTYNLKENHAKLQSYAYKEHDGNSTAAIRQILRDFFANKEQKNGN